MSLLFVQTTKSHGTSSASPVPIPELSLTIPEGEGEQALVILNLPNVYVLNPAGNDPGGKFTISANGTVLPAYACMTPVSNGLVGNGRQTVTLVVAVPLMLKLQPIVAMWQALNSCHIVLDSPASLSART